MFKAIILDIDGVILGHTDGVNFPLPSLEVQRTLRGLAQRGIPVSLCTVKAPFAVEPIVTACGLQENTHITDAGASLVNFSKKQVNSHLIASSIFPQIIDAASKAQIYMECYTSSTYYAPRFGSVEIRNRRTKLLGREAELVEAFDTAISYTKIIAFPFTETQENTLRSIEQTHKTDIALHWGKNPSLIPAEYGFFTAASATKRNGAITVAEEQGISLADTLAVGDSTNDWTFMDLCGYVGTLANGSEELKELIRTRENNSYISSYDVDNDGVVDIIAQLQK